MKVALWLIAALLVIAWAAGFLFLKVAGAAIHLALVLAVVAAIASFFVGARAGRAV